MTDIREDVLVRLHEVCAGIENIRFCKRNVGVDIPDTELPAIVVFDADEESDTAEDYSMRPSNRPTMVVMVPEVVVIQQAKEAGSDLTTLRRRLIKKVLEDEELQEIVGAGDRGAGAIRYGGCQTDFGAGRSLQGGLKAQFIFRYPLFPSLL